MRTATANDLIFVLIAGLLLLLYALPSFRAESREARESLYRDALEQVCQGLEEFYARYGRYPVNDQRFLPSQLEALDSFSYPALLREHPFFYHSDGDSYRILLPLSEKRALSTDSLNPEIRNVTQTVLP